jgi:hypothetical protein
VSSANVKLALASGARSNEARIQAATANLRLADVELAPASGGRSNEAHIFFEPFKIMFRNRYHP